MDFLLSRPVLKTLAACLAIECAAFLLFYAGTGRVPAAVYYSVLIGPLSLFFAPPLYRRFSAGDRGPILQGDAEVHYPLNWRARTVRGFAGLISVAAALVWAPLMLLSGGKLVSELTAPATSLVGFFLALATFCGSLGFTALFAAAIMTARYGAPRPRFLALCIVLGLMTCVGAWLMFASVQARARIL